MEEKDMTMIRIMFTNDRACGCVSKECTAHLEAGQGVGIVLHGQGGGNRYLCPTHARALEELRGYHCSAMQGWEDILGTPKKTPLAKTTMGFELENVNMQGINSYELRFRLAEVGLLERDCTVDCEVPTKPMQGLKTLERILNSIELYGALPCFNNPRCGAHMHVYCSDVLYIRRYYHSIFLPLQGWLNSIGAEKRVEFFGSDYRGYASPINSYSSPTEHSNVFNTQHPKTLEFRLPRITGKAQYMKIAFFWREVGFTINSWDLHKDGNAQERKESAQALGARLVEIARKYYE